MNKFYLLLKAVAALSICTSFPAFAQYNVEQIADINKDGADSDVSLSVRLNNVTYFTADDGVHGRELWKLPDGGEPVLVKDIIEGAQGGSPQNFTVVNNTIFFTAATYAHSDELWKTDGTTAGTVLVKDINTEPGLYGTRRSNPEELVAFNGKLYFEADDGVNGDELWVSDGTASGTQLLKDFTADDSSSINKIVAGTSGLLFDINGELGYSDGTSAGTVLIDLNAGGDSQPKEFMTDGDTVYFSAVDGASGRELWSFDLSIGPGSQTMLVNINPGSGSSTPKHFTLYGGSVYFQAYTSTVGYDLWFWSSVPGAIPIDINPGNASSYPKHLTVVGNTLYFQAETDADGKELWWHNDAANQTGHFNINITGDSDPQSLTAAGNRLFFTAETSENGEELWSIIESGIPTLVKDITPGEFDGIFYSSDTMLINSSNTLLFPAQDDSNGTQLWKSDGTAAGTTLLADLNANNAGGIRSPAVEMNDQLYFVAADGVHGQELWAWDGTDVRLVKDIYSGPRSSNPDDFTVVGNTLYFIAEDEGHGEELWKSDGTTSGTVLVKDLTAGPDDSNIYAMHAYNDVLLFSGPGPSWQAILWITDGTAAGTQVLANLEQPDNFVTLNNVVYFGADDDINGYEIFKTDGTPAGTTLAVDVDMGASGIELKEMVIWKDKLWFIAKVDFFQSETLWSSDGSTATLLIDLDPASTEDRIQQLLPIPSTDRMIFVGKTDALGGEMWVTDGTSAGTYIIVDEDPGPGSSIDEPLVAVFNNAAYWTSSYAGEPHLLRYTPDEGAYTINTDSDNFGAFSFAEFDGKFFIGGSTIAGGGELYRLNSTGDGIVLVHEFNDFTGAGGWPNYLVPFNEGLFFAARDNQAGFEPWFLTKTQPGGDGANSPPQVTVAGGGGGAFGWLFLALLGLLQFSIKRRQKAVFVENRKSKKPALLIKAVAILSLLAVWPAHAQYGVERLADINQDGADSEARLGVRLNNVTYFVADDGLHGKELWKLPDGGTAELVKDINPGIKGSRPESMAVVDNTVFFVATIEAYGTELWKTDGTLSGTVLVEDINTTASIGGTEDSNPRDFAVLNGKLFFVADDGVHGKELWVSNGTAAGTYLLKDLTVGDGSDIYEIAAGTSGLIFNINNELGYSDGTTAGTVIIDINPSGSSGADKFLVDGDTAYFTAWDGTHGAELWTMNLAAGPGSENMLADILPGGDSSRPDYLTLYAGALYFAATSSNGRELWFWDSVAGAVEVDDINPGSSGSSPLDLTVVGNTLYFNAGTNGDYRELWWYHDNTDTLNHANINVSESSHPLILTAAGNTLFFLADDGVTGNELWKIVEGGVPALVKDIWPGERGSNDYTSQHIFLVDNSNNLLFSAEDGANGVQLWKSDGTAAGTSIVADINAGTASSNIEQIVTMNGQIFFTADDGEHGEELWAWDGTSFRMVKDIYAGPERSRIDNLTVVGNTLYFAATDKDHGEELWKSDGTASGTVMVKEFTPGTDSSSVSTTYAYNGKLIVSIVDGASVNKLWITDGTAGGTQILADIQGSEGYVELDDIVYFTARNSTHGDEIFKTDGTAAGTTLAIEMAPGPDSTDFGSLTVWRDKLWFSAEISAAQPEALYSSDGNAATLLVDIDPGSTDDFIRGLQPLLSLDRMIFLGQTDANGLELWMTDGTAAGTQIVAEQTPGTVSSIAYYLSDVVEFNNAIYWNACSASTCELMRYTVNDHASVVVASPETFYARSFTVFDNKLFMGGSTRKLNYNPDRPDSAIALNNVELYHLTDSGDGVELVHEFMAIEDAGGVPIAFVPFNNGVFFLAQDSQTGQEPWFMTKTQPSGDGANNPPQVTVGGGGGGAFGWLCVVLLGLMHIPMRQRQ